MTGRVDRVDLEDRGNRDDRLDWCRRVAALGIAVLGIAVLGSVVSGKLILEIVRHALPGRELLAGFGGHGRSELLDRRIGLAQLLGRRTAVAQLPGSCRGLVIKWDGGTAFLDCLPFEGIHRPVASAVELAVGVRRVPAVSSLAGLVVESSTLPSVGYMILDLEEGGSGLQESGAALPLW